MTIDYEFQFYLLRYLSTLKSVKGLSCNKIQKVLEKKGILFDYNTLNIINGSEHSLITFNCNIDFVCGAIYIALVCGNNRVSVYTLEKGLNKDYFFCKIHHNTHFNIEHFNKKIPEDLFIHKSIRDCLISNVINN